LGTSREHFLFISTAVAILSFLCHNGWELFGNFREHFLFLLQCYPFYFLFLFSFNIARLRRWGFFRVQASNENCACWGRVGWGGQIVRYYRFLVLKIVANENFVISRQFVCCGWHHFGLGWALKLGGKMCSNVPPVGALEGPKKADPKTTTTTNNFSCSL
jgi:hypothetical protein